VSERFLPYGRQEITDEDEAAVVAALREPMITQGPTVLRFERAFAEKVGATHAVAFANGTAALHGAAHAAGLGQGDESITAAMTFAASANCARYLGADVRLLDIDLATWNLDVRAAVAAAGDRTRAVVPVSFAGLPVDLAPLQALRERGVTVIEDGSHAVGAYRDGVPVGADDAGADLTTFSFHPVKNMTTAEGGMVTTASSELADRLRTFRTHGIYRNGMAAGPDDGAWWYEQRELGFNYRITDIQCALGLSQLARVDEWVDARNAHAAHYRELLADEKRIELPPEPPEGWRHGRHLFPVLVKAGAPARRTVFEALRDDGIGVQVHYIPLYRFPYWRERGRASAQTCPETERYYAGAISLPMFPGLVEGDVKRVVAALGRALDASA
jgi:UDP-4-amino-4,6-dideoxy-N-acetyl-beta-L-altrosamine transaminase